MTTLPYPWLATITGWEAVLPTSTPGLVIVRYRRQRLRDGRRSRVYVVTHELSGIALTQTFDSAAGPGHLRFAQATAAKLGETRWKGKPFDWTQNVDTIRDNRRASAMRYFVNGWIMLNPHKGDLSIDEQHEAYKAWRAAIGYPKATSAVGGLSMTNCTPDNTK